MTAHSFFYNKYFSYLASISLVVVTAFFLVERKIFDKGIYFFVLSGIVLFLLNFRAIKLSKIEVAIIGGAILYIFIAYILIFISAQEEYGWYLVSKIYVKMLIFIPVMFYFKYADFDDNTIWASFLLGAIVAGMLAVNEMWIFPEGQYDYPGRASGNINPNLFATVSLSFSALAAFSFSKQKLGKVRNAVLLLIPVLLGLTATILSGSKGVWLAIPVFLILAVNYHFSHISNLVKIGVVGVIITLFVLLYFIPQTGVSKRIDVSVEEFKNYHSSEISARVQRSSVGSRLEMWQAALTAFKENPVFGVGTGGYLEFAKGLVAKGERSEGALFAEPHNQYLSILSMRGIVGFSGFIILIGSIVYLFFTAMRSKQDDLIRYGYAGMSVCIVYLIHGLTDIPFERRSTVFFFSFICGLLVGKILNQRNNYSSD